MAQYYIMLLQVYVVGKKSHASYRTLALGRQLFFRLGKRVCFCWFRRHLQKLCQSEIKQLLLPTGVTMFCEELVVSQVVC